MDKLRALRRKVKNLCDGIESELDSIGYALDKYEEDQLEEGWKDNYLIIKVENLSDKEKLLNFINRTHWIELKKDKL